MHRWEQPLAMLLSLQGLLSIAAAAWIGITKVSPNTSTGARWLIALIVFGIAYDLIGRAWTWLNSPAKSAKKRTRNARA